VLNGVSRPFFGWLSDVFGRENTMFVAFTVEALSFLLLAKFGANPVAFVFIASLMFFAYGEIYSLFPAAAADSYGKKFVSANAGLLYTAKGMAALLVPLATIGAARFGGWNVVFTIIAGLNIIAALLAIIGMKPLRARIVTQAAPVPVPQPQLDPTT
jgi:OFA family oxalate/formate antiporter-like MFS transporter